MSANREEANNALGIYQRLRFIEHQVSSTAEGLSMIKFGHAATICCLLVGALVSATSEAQTRPPIAQQIADAYGLASFERIEAVRGSGSPRTTKSRMRGKTKAASL